MRKLVLEIIAATALTLCSILASTPGVLANDVMVMDAFARASATSMAKAGAVYMTLTNHGATPDRLLAASTPAAVRAAARSRRVRRGIRLP